MEASSRRLRRDLCVLMSDDGFGRFKREKAEKKEGVKSEGQENQVQSDQKEKTEKELKGDEKDAEKNIEEKLTEEKIRLEDLKNKINEELRKLNKENKKNQSKQSEEATQDTKKEGGTQGSGPNPPNQPSKYRQLINWFIIGFLIVLLISALTADENIETEITIDQFFQDFVRNNRVDTISITRTLEGKTNPTFKVSFSVPENAHGYRFTVKNLDEFLSQLKKMRDPPVKYSLNSSFKESVFRNIKSNFTNDLMYLVFFGIFFWASWTMFKQGLKTMQRQNRFDDKDNAFINRLRKDVQRRGSGSRVKFEDVAGMDEAKKEITEFVDFLTNKEQFSRLGAKIPRGGLLTGPPGTGKTLLAKACANESNVPFISVPGSEFVEVIVGVGASRMRAVFDVAKENAPCIVFIDEIDAIAKKRSTGTGSVNEERENTLNQLLVEMDGFGSQSNVIVFAATNMKDALDPAVLRPGRFDRIIDIPLPDIEARKKIFLIHLGKIVLDSTKKAEDYANRLATLTPGFSGAQIENICNEAAIIAARVDAMHVNMEDFERAVERVIAGLEKKTKLDQEQKKLTAVQEAGKAVVSWFVKNGPPVLKLTVVPRSKGAKGFSQYLANENMLNTKQDLNDLICISLSGILTEEAVFGRRTASSAEDLHKVHGLAHQLATTFGMSSLGPVHRSENDYGYRSYSEAVNYKIDQEKMAIVKQCEEKTRKLIEEKLPLINKLADLLIEKETLNFQQIKAVLGERPHPPRGSYKQYLDEIGSLDGEPAEPEEKPSEPQAISEPRVNLYSF